MDFKFFRVVRIMRLVGIKINLTEQLPSVLICSIKLYVMSRYLILSTGRFSLRWMETTKP